MPSAPGSSGSRTLLSGHRVPPLRWLLGLLAAAIAFTGVAWLQSQAVLAFDVRSDAPVRLQIFHAAAGDFSEEHSTRVIARPDAGGRVRIRLPADRTAHLRLDPSPGAPPFDVCGLHVRDAGDAAYRPGGQNELTWVPGDACTRLVPDAASADPYLVLVSEAPAGAHAARGWRRAAGIGALVALVLLVLVAHRLDRPGTARSRAAERIFAALSARAHWIALVLMVALGSLIAHALPPSGVPDEVAHMSKVAKVNAGVLLSDSGPVPVANVPAMYAGLKDIRDPAVIDRTALAAALDRPLACDRAPRALPPSADAYAPHLYAAPAVVLAASCAVGTSFGTFLTLSRIVNLILAAVLAAIGIRYAAFGKWSLVVVALLPMTLAQVASVSADSLTLGLSFCFIGLVSGIAGGGLPPSRMRYWLPALALLLAFSKPGGAWILVAILFCRHAYVAEGRSFAAAVVAVLVVPWLVHAGWVLLSSTGATALAGVDPESNLALLRQDPGQVAELVLATFSGSHGTFLYESTLGLLGWLDVPLSGWAYALGSIALAASLWTNARGPANPMLVKPIALAAAAGSLAMLSLPLYLYWTDPASGVVMGLQGRYFLPTLAFVLVWMAMRGPPVLRAILLGLVLTVPALTLDAVRQIHDRYYLVGL